MRPATGLSAVQVLLGGCVTCVDVTAFMPPCSLPPDAGILAF